MKIKILLTAVILLAGLLRLFQLTSYPSGFHIDEATLGYNSYSILKTGRDETGRFLPLYSQSFGLDRAIGNFLLTAASISLFGLNELAVRLPFSFFGLLTVIIIYFFAKEIFANRLFALIATLFMSISPWHLDIVRASSEASVSLFLIILGQLMFIKGAKQSSLIKLIIAGLSLLVSVLFYHAALGYVVIMLPFIGFYFIRKINKNITKIEIGTLVLVSVFLSIVYLIIGAGATSRFSQVGFHKDPTVLNEQNKMFYEEGKDNIFQARAFHNKFVTYARAILVNYSNYFTLNFLYLNAGLPPRYTPPAMGLIYLIELPFLIFGLSKAILDKSSNLKLLVGLLFLSPLVAAITYEYTPNVQRSFFMVPYLEILAAFGLFSTLNYFKAQRFLSFVLASLFSVSILYYFHQYYVHFPVHNPLFRNDGEKELVTQINSLKDKYYLIIMSSDPEPPFHYFLFFDKFDPVDFQKKYVQVKNSPSGWIYENKILFFRETCPTKFEKQYKQQKYLFVDHGQCDFDSGENGMFKLVAEIKRKDSSLLYRFLERKT